MSTQTSDLKKLRNKIVKLTHPDLAFDEKDRRRSERLMQEANDAYIASDEAALRAILEAVLNPSSAPPPPPKAPPNAWGPRTYETPPRAAQAQQQPPPAGVQPGQRAQKVSTSFTAWFWIVWGLWSVTCLIVGHGWLILVGLFASLFIAHYLVKVQRSIENYMAKVQHFAKTWWAQSTNKGGQLFAFGCLVVVFALALELARSTPAPSPFLHRVGDAPASVRTLRKGDRIEVGGDLRKTSPGSIDLVNDQVENPPADSDPSYARKVIEKTVDNDIGVPSGAILCLDPGTLAYTFALDTAGEATCADQKAVLIMKSVAAIQQHGAGAAQPGATMNHAIVANQNDAPVQKASANEALAKVWEGTYIGTAHNMSSGRDAEITVRITKNNNEAISGYFSVEPPLYGSGPLTVTSMIGDTLKFHVVPAHLTGYELDFEGRHTGLGVISGTYSVTQDEKGTFMMHLKSVSTVPEPSVSSNPPAPVLQSFDSTSYGVKVQEMIQQSFEKWPSGSAPTGTEVALHIRINDEGAPDGIVLNASSGWQGVDRACIAAASGIDNFGSPPGGTMVGDYKCVVK